MLRQRQQVASMQQQMQYAARMLGPPTVPSAYLPQSLPPQAFPSPSPTGPFLSSSENNSNAMSVTRSGMHHVPSSAYLNAYSAHAQWNGADANSNGVNNNAVYAHAAATPTMQGQMTAEEQRFLQLPRQLPSQ